MWRLTEARRWARTARPDRHRLNRALWRLLWIDLGVRAFGFARLSKRLEKGRCAAEPGRGEAEDRQAVAAWTWAVDVAARHHFYPMRCVPRALALRSFLAQEGIETELRIGVRKDGDGLAAHAWIEHLGVPVGEPPEIAERFAPLVQADGAKRSVLV